MENLYDSSYKSATGTSVLSMVMRKVYGRMFLALVVTALTFVVCGFFSGHIIGRFGKPGCLFRLDDCRTCRCFRCLGHVE